MIVCFTAESCLCDGNRYNESKRQEEMTEVRSYTITDFQWEIVILKFTGSALFPRTSFGKQISLLNENLTRNACNFLGY